MRQGIGVHPPASDEIPQVGRGIGVLVCVGVRLAVGVLEATGVLVRVAVGPGVFVFVGGT